MSRASPTTTAHGLAAPKPGASGLAAPKPSGASGLAAPKPSGEGGATGLVLPGERPADQVAFETALVDFFVDAADLLGVPKSVAAIYGIVFASPVSLSFAEIEARLNFSKGSVSQGLRVLKEVGALKEVSAAADRAELFTPDLQLRNLVARFLENRVQKQLAAGSARLKVLGQAVPGGKGDTEVLRQRLKHLQNWHDKARALMPVARTFLKLG